jgi:transcriptional regulator with PAS, ATPase and Fis domain
MNNFGVIMNINVDVVKGNSKMTIPAKFIFHGIISKCKIMFDLIKEIKIIAPTNDTILIQGETGVGKDLFAKVIHEISKRKDSKFNEIECTSIPEGLFESELFGYKRGSFTGAIRDFEGQIASTNGGTVFLNEIGLLPLNMQGKILRLIEKKCFTPIGSTNTVNVDVRFICATNRNLLQLVFKNEFLPDLYYRLNEQVLNIPSLSKRKRDISLLARYFVEKLNEENEKSISGISRRGLELLLKHDYLGNVRELQKIIKCAYSRCDNHIISPSHLTDQNL